MIDRRRFLASGLVLPLVGAASTAYAVGVEPNFLLRIKRYALTPAGWPPDLRLRLVVLSDLHAGEPFMSAARIRRICLAANALQPDAIALLGDYNAGHFFVTRAVDEQQTAEALSTLQAPLGVFAVLGNHDWRHGPLLTSPPDGATAIRRGLRQAGIAVLENDAVPLAKDGRKFWIVGLGDQLLELDDSHGFDPAKLEGGDDLDGALAKVTDSAPVVLLAHEPMIFSAVPRRVALTLCGHTHGGQINLPLLGPVIGDIRFGRYAYGHVQRDQRHLIVSGGLGESIVPARLFRPPEIVEVVLGAPRETQARWAEW